jgi:hypothetical protein
MVNRFATLAAVCTFLPVGLPAVASADPAPDPDPSDSGVSDPAVQPVDNPGGPPDNGAVPSAAPGILDTPDGWHISVVGSNESQLPVAPLTTAITSREYIVGGTFTGTVTGAGRTKLTGGTLEAGEQIGCGIINDEYETNGIAGLTPALSVAGVPTIGASISFQGKVYLKPGTVTIVPLDKKAFKDTGTRVTFSGVRVKFDTCAGQSFIRSYATMTSSTDNTDDVITYLGYTKAV